MVVNNWALVACIVAMCFASYELGKLVMQIKLKKSLQDLAQYISKCAEELKTKQKEGSKVETNVADQNSQGG